MINELWQNVQNVQAIFKCEFYYKHYNDDMDHKIESNSENVCELDVCSRF